MSYLFPGGDSDDFARSSNRSLQESRTVPTPVSATVEIPAFLNAIKDAQRTAEILRRASLPYEQIPGAIHISSLLGACEGPSLSSVT